jgi:proteasome lid subunit RPN8/RPN11
MPEPLLPDEIAAHILDESARALPREACGVLLGVLAAGRPEVRAQRPVPNDAAEATHRFAIPAARVRAAQLAARRAGLDVIGFWHSHPRGPGAPSPEDLDAALPGYLYVIVDVRTGTVTSWRLRDDRRAFEPADA